MDEEKFELFRLMYCNKYLVGEASIRQTLNIYQKLNNTNVSEEN